MDVKHTCPTLVVSLCLVWMPVWAVNANGTNDSVALTTLATASTDLPVEDEIYVTKSTPGLTFTPPNGKVKPGGNLTVQIRLPVLSTIRNVSGQSADASIAYVTRNARLIWCDKPETNHQTCVKVVIAGRSRIGNTEIRITVDTEETNGRSRGFTGAYSVAVVRSAWRRTFHNLLSYIAAGMSFVLFLFAGCATKRRDIADFQGWIIGSILLQMVLVPFVSTNNLSEC